MEDQPFLRVIDRLCYEASVDIEGMVEQPLPRGVGERAGVSDGEPASGEPAALGRDYLSTVHMTAFADSVVRAGTDL